MGLIFVTIVLETVDLIVFNKLTQLKRYHIFFFIFFQKDSSSKRHNSEICGGARFTLNEKCSSFIYYQHQSHRVNMVLVGRFYISRCECPPAQDLQWIRYD